MISRELYDEYARAIDANADLLQAAVAQLAARLSGVPPSDVEHVLTAAYAALVDRYGSFAAAIAVDFYARLRGQVKYAGIEALIAESVETSADRSSVTFRLRPQARFSDGR